MNWTPINKTAESYVTLPLDVGDAWIPREMSAEDFDLMLDTLKLWREKLVAKTKPKAELKETL